MMVLYEKKLTELELLALFSTSFVSDDVLVVCSDFCVSDDVLLFEFELSSTDV